MGNRRDYDEDDIETTDGQPPREGWEDGPAPAPQREDGQHEAYWVLSEEERAKGFVRPVRRSYVHTEGCGKTTTMRRDLAETMARDPDFYDGAYCAHCGDHFPLHQFTWKDDGTEMGS